MLVMQRTKVIICCATRTRRAPRSMRFLQAFLVTALLVTVEAVAQQAAQQAAPAPSVVATVNGAQMTAARYRDTYADYLIATGKNDTPANRRAHLNSLVDTYLLAAEARRRGLENDPAFQAFASLRIKQIVGSRYFEQAFFQSLPAPSDADLREAYERANAKLSLRQLYFRNPQQAQAAYARLQSGADFVALANEVYGTARPDSTAGWLGTAGYWELDDAIADAVYDTPVGSYTPPVRSRFGWHIVRVEGMVRNPLLLEDAYQAQKPKLVTLLRERRFNVEGARFLENMMEQVTLELNAEAITALTQAIRRAAGIEAPETPDLALLSSEVAAIERALEPETVLGSYLMDGRRYALMAGDYHAWLGALPPREVRTRTVASVGRALRNEVLAERGFALGLERDSVVLASLEDQTTAFLADLLAQKLRADTTVVSTEAERQRAFTALGYDGIAEAAATFWAVSFATAAEANEALRALKADNATPSRFDTFAAYEHADLTRLGEMGRHVRNAPLGETLLMGLPDGAWMLVHVTDRTVRHATLDERAAEVERAIQPHLAEMRLLEALRADAAITINAEAIDAALEGITAR